MLLINKTAQRAALRGQASAWYWRWHSRGARCHSAWSTVWRSGVLALCHTFWTKDPITKGRPALDSLRTTRRTEVVSVDYPPGTDSLSGRENWRATASGLSPSAWLEDGWVRGARGCFGNVNVKHNAQLESVGSWLSWWDFPRSWISHDKPTAGPWKQILIGLLTLNALDIFCSIKVRALELWGSWLSW